MRWLEFVFEEPRLPIALEIRRIAATGKGPGTAASIEKRIEVPNAVGGPPEPGRRVYRTLQEWRQTEVKHVRTLPRNWRPGKKYPVLVELTGNRFYHKFCYSTGYTADGHMAYGLAAGEDYIILNLPFISEDGQREQIYGWGDIERAVGYCFAALTDAQENFGADPRVIVYVGFSRGAYAANYLALRNDRIAAVWAGFVTRRSPGMKWHGPGLGWREVGEGWDERAERIGEAPWFYADSGLGDGVHVDGEFLEDWPSTLATRKWLRNLVSRRMAD